MTRDQLVEKMVGLLLAERDALPEWPDTKNLVENSCSIEGIDEWNQWIEDLDLWSEDTESLLHELTILARRLRRKCQKSKKPSPRSP